MVPDRGVPALRADGLAGKPRRAPLRLHDLGQPLSPAAFPGFPVKKITEKAITIKSARGHSFRACELAVRQLASGRFPLQELATNRFALGHADQAIRAVGGEAGEDVVHVSLLPWED